jgi:predicted transcriptional regulator
MPRPASLSDVEWKILKLLWKKGVLSVREVWQQLYPDGQKAYTTVQTYMDRMVEKGYLRKEKIGLANFYQPIVEKKSLVEEATEKLVTRAFDGSFGRLAAFLLDSDNLSEEDLKIIKEMIAKKEKE